MLYALLKFSELLIVSTLWKLVMPCNVCLVRLILSQFMWTLYWFFFKQLFWRETFSILPCYFQSILVYSELTDSTSHCYIVVCIYQSNSWYCYFNFVALWLSVGLDFLNVAPYFKLSMHLYILCKKKRELSRNENLVGLLLWKASCPAKYFLLRYGPFLGGKLVESDNCSMNSIVYYC